MVEISETSDDSNGGDDQDPNKNKPQEELQKNPRKSVEKITSFHIPDDITEECLAYVGRFHYPDLSLVSKTFSRIIKSPILYDLRSRLGSTEPVLYACVGITRFTNPNWYILYRKPYRNLRNTVSLQLREIRSPPMPWGSAVVTIGHEMYVIGGCVGEKRTKNVILIDCRFHKCRFLPSMQVARCRAAAGVFDGKIIVIGGCEIGATEWLETFDVKDKVWKSYKWSPDSPQQPNVSSEEFVTYAMMEERLYVLSKTTGYAYDNRGEGGSWPKLEVGDVMMSFWWQESSCVIDGLLFSTNPQRVFSDSAIIIYDPKEKSWEPLTGLQGFPSNILLHESKMANFGGKLVILGTDESRYSKYDGKKEIWCVEIALETRQGGEISGKIESVAVVLTVPPASIELCRTVTV
ncbi:hypothetical protein EUTSA_v10017939mg [Eutrema salsugineum]|uniref:F-box domain-containing protein n=1 Tax=Eutrema salsugineum TaxID=72664 RepID=V4NXN3_EUTSA|nr:putative F-box/kelch-repeat protein At2g21680 [Eutrema salsugineum]ESQ51671.1 hypothetical protein EUTSA_v10017939mg [Eutrema salsugineum]